MASFNNDIDTQNTVHPPISIRNETEYDNAVQTLNSLIDEVGTNEEHPLYELLDILGTLIHAYEEKHHPIPDCSGIEMLKYLMEEHQCGLSDLPELGSQDTVLKILKEERELTITQIRVLANRFQVNPSVFMVKNINNYTPTPTVGEVS